MIPLSVSEISALDGFCDKQHEDEEELGILVVGFNIVNVAKEILVTPASANVVIKSSQMGARVGVWRQLGQTSGLQNLLQLTQKDKNARI